MLRVYILPIEKVDNTERVKGIRYIHNALMECTEEPEARRVIMDTSPKEHSRLSKIAIETRNPTGQEKANFERFSNYREYPFMGNFRINPKHLSDGELCAIRSWLMDISKLSVDELRNVRAFFENHHIEGCIIYRQIIESVDINEYNRCKLCDAAIEEIRRELAQREINRVKRKLWRWGLALFFLGLVLGTLITWLLSFFNLLSQ